MDVNKHQIPVGLVYIASERSVGFFLLYISIFVGTVSCLPGIKSYFLKLRSLNFHCWISVQAFLFAAIHGISLLFDKVHSFFAGRNIYSICFRLPAGSGCARNNQFLSDDNSHHNFLYETIFFL